MLKRELNVKLLRKIQKLFREKPSKSAMVDYAAIKDRYCDKFEEGDEIPFCKTHLCIGGAAMVLSGKAVLKYENGEVRLVDAESKGFLDYEKTAAEVLGMSPKDARFLFHEPNWPDQFITPGNYRGSRTLAKNMVARIEHLIKTGK